MKYFTQSFFLGLLFAFLLIPQYMYAHGSGASIEKVVDAYLVDIGYTPEAVEEGTQVRFDFLLFDNASGTEEVFTDVWVRIEQGKKLLFAGGIAKPVFGTTGLSYSFLDAGEYEIFVRFQNAKEALVETTIDFSVAEKEKKFTEEMFSGKTLLIVGFISLAVGALVLFGVFTMFGTPKRPATVQQTKPSVFLESVLYIGIGSVVAIGAFFLFNFLFTNTDIQNQDIQTEKEEIPVVFDGESVNIVLTKSGYEPSEVTIKKGTRVTFSSTSGRPHWPASNLHPTHGIFPEFDPREPIVAEESWSFVFDKVGEWKFHDHLRSYFTGVIRVTE